MTVSAFNQVSIVRTVAARAELSQVVSRGVLLCACPSPPRGRYLKDVTCDGTTLRNSFKLGESDCGLRITVGTDIGKLTARILDKDNKEDLNSLVCVAASSALTREDIALTGSCSPIEPGTTSASIALRPDRYFALAMPAGTADWVEYFLANRGQGTPIEIKPRAAAQVTLKSR